MNLLFFGVLALLATGAGVWLFFSPFGVRLGAWYHHYQWTSHHLTSYRYIARFSCYCPEDIVQPAQIEVRDGVTVSITYVSTGKPVKTQQFDEVRTIDRIFTFITTRAQEDAASIWVEYDPTYSVPLKIRSNSIISAGEDERTLSIEHFEVLP